jgi:hypothetical protein
MHYKHNIHNKKQISIIKLILMSHINALNTARGLDGLVSDRNAAHTSVLQKTHGYMAALRGFCASGHLAVRMTHSPTQTPPRQ